jgi:hypothetical protein
MPLAPSGKLVDHERSKWADSHSAQLHVTKAAISLSNNEDGIAEGCGGRDAEDLAQRL